MLSKMFLKESTPVEETHAGVVGRNGKNKSQKVCKNLRNFISKLYIWHGMLTWEVSSL